MWKSRTKATLGYSKRENSQVWELKSFVSQPTYSVFLSLVGKMLTSDTQQTSMLTNISESTIADNLTVSFLRNGGQSEKLLPLSHIQITLAF